MRKPATVERLYLDFDGFFAAVEQQVRPALRGRPVGVVPFASTTHTCVIACSKEAKRRGVATIMPVLEARRICPEIALVPQNPDLYRRAAELHGLAKMPYLGEVKKHLASGLRRRSAARPDGPR